MTRDEFEQLRNLKDKTIVGDVEFAANSSNPDILRFDRKIDNSLGYEVRVTGTYKRMIPSLTFNFRVIGVGAVCRFDINGSLHKDADTDQNTRNHKHSLQTEHCPGQNLRHARHRSDLDLGFKSVEDIWRQVCIEANIDHHGALLIK